MTSQIRQDLLNVLEELRECAPGVRFGQLIANLSYLAKGPTNDPQKVAQDGSHAAITVTIMERPA
jgi:hypothetical protein